MQMVMFHCYCEYQFTGLETIADAFVNASIQRCQRDPDRRARSELVSMRLWT